MKCLRCGGKMASEKFIYGDSSFLGWFCVMCGDVLDPVILLHRLSKNPKIDIPKKEKTILHLIEKFQKRSTRENRKVI